MVIKHDEDITEAASKIGVHPQEIAEAFQIATKEDITAKTTSSFKTLCAIYTQAPKGTKLRAFAFGRLHELAESDNDWDRFSELTLPEKAPHKFSWYRVVKTNMAKVRIWFCLLVSTPEKIYQIRWAWNAYRRAEVGSNSRRDALVKVVILL